MVIVVNSRRLAVAALLATLVATTAEAQGTIPLWRQQISANSSYGEVVVDAQDNVVVGFLATGPAYELAKISPAGDILWTASTGTQRGFSHAVDPAGNVVVGGENFVAKFDSAGTLLWWNETIEWVTAVGADDAGDVYYALNPAEFGDDVLRLTKLTPSGAAIWVRDEPAPIISGQIIPRRILVDPLQQVHVLNWTLYNSFWGRHHTVSYSAGGDLLGSVGDFGYPMDAVVDGSGRVVVASTIYLPPYDSYLGGIGASTWVAGNEGFESIDLARNDDLIIGSHEYPTQNTSPKVAVIQRRSAADFSLIAKYPPPPTGTAVPDMRSVTTDSQGNVFLLLANQQERTLEVQKLALDTDGDGAAESLDCNDRDASIYPGAVEVKRDGIDQDCNGYDLTIEVLKAVFDPAAGSVRVEATSALDAKGIDAKLELAGVGPMTFKVGKQPRWVINAPFAAAPVSVTVRGIEGSVTVPTITK